VSFKTAVNVTVCIQLYTICVWKKTKHYKNVQMYDGMIVQQFN